jgi:hypothetical protein
MRQQRGHSTTFRSFTRRNRLTPSAVVISLALVPSAVHVLAAAEELNGAEKRKGFEFYRTNLRDVENINYDELIKKWRRLQRYSTRWGRKRDSLEQCLPFCRTHQTRSGEGRWSIHSRFSNSSRNTHSGLDCR